MSELKNCPFCGGDCCEMQYPQVTSNYKTETKYSAGCPNCGVWTDYCDTEEQAITAWNRRADRWIPASNPPKTSSDYLVETGSKRPFSAFYAEVANMWVKGDENIRPTHWMPLPAPPEGVEQG